jgi:ribosomal protein S18 acetylase RimI-like enzyme
MRHKYTGATYTQKEDMYKCYELMTQINPDLKLEDYKNGIDRITTRSNYVQHVVLCNDIPVSVVATQEVFTIGVLPRPALKIDNVATLPEHRGHVTRFLMQNTIDKYTELGYGKISLCSANDNYRAGAFYKKSGFENATLSWSMRVNQEGQPQQRAKL